MLEDLVYETKL